MQAWDANVVIDSGSGGKTVSFANKLALPIEGIDDVGRTLTDTYGRDHFFCKLRALGICYADGGGAAPEAAPTW